MASYNRIIIMGNLTRDPEYKQLSSGQSVCRLGLAANRQFKNRQTGQAVQEVCFIDVDVWGAQAESCHQYLVKGRSILVEGRLKFDSWEDADGQKRSKHSIVADSVKFLNGQGDDASKVTEDNYDEEPKKAAPIKAAQSARPEKKAKASENELNPSGEIAFKDEQPFDDDLPF